MILVGFWCACNRTVHVTWNTCVAENCEAVGSHDVSKYAPRQLIAFILNMPFSTIFLSSQYTCYQVTLPGGHNWIIHTSISSAFPSPVLSEYRHLAFSGISTVFPYWHMSDSQTDFLNPHDRAINSLQWGPRKVVFLEVSAHSLLSRVPFRRRC